MCCLVASTDAFLRLIVEMQWCLTVLNNCSYSAWQPVISFTGCLTAKHASRGESYGGGGSRLDYRSNVEKEAFAAEQERVF